MKQIYQQKYNIDLTDRLFTEIKEEQLIDETLEKIKKIQTETGYYEHFITFANKYKFIRIVSFLEISENCNYDQYKVHNL